MSTALLFAYGSLMKGFHNHDKGVSGRIVATYPAKVQGTLYHLSKRGYPALMPGDGFVYGECMEVTDVEETLAICDAIEDYHGVGANNEYNRLVTVVERLDTNELVPAYVYWYAQGDQLDANGAVPIPDGNWRTYMTER